jgi:hypothetical protein
MKFNCGPTKEERKEERKARLSDWHRFFCIWPRRVGYRDCRWLEWIERKRGEYPWIWEYRARSCDRDEPWSVADVDTDPIESWSNKDNV